MGNDFYLQVSGLFLAYINTALDYCLSLLPLLFLGRVKALENGMKKHLNMLRIEFGVIQMVLTHTLNLGLT